VTVYGTLKEPVHACNLAETLSRIEKKHPSALILAVDASLGNKKHLGYAAIANGALIPGAAVSKNLPPVGDIHITGVVNTSGCQEYLMLQTTRLANVLALSDNIAQGILLAMPAILRL
jgi:putative sporulation protein YyaC